MSEPRSSGVARSIYLDWNATAPPHPAVLLAMAEAAQSGWANPSSVHAHGRKARALVEDARVAIARLVGRNPRDVVLTSGGTEANNLALAGAPALVTSRLEHPSIVRVAEEAERRGVVVRWLPVPESGRLDPESVEQALRGLDAGAVVAMSAVNHETGVLGPVREVEAIAARAGAVLHVDAVQAAGRLEPEAWQWGATLSLAAHKLRGPKGIGALVSTPGRGPKAVLFGGSQERGFRPGTLDPLALAGFRIAAEHALTGPARYARLAPLRAHLEHSLSEVAEVNGLGAPRAPHVSNLSFGRARGDELAAALDLEGISVSSGSACSAGTSEPSPVITAMLGPSRARSALRVSLGDETTRDEIDALLAVLPRLLERGRVDSSGVA